MESVLCDLCGGNDCEPVLVGRDHLLKGDAQFQVVRCRECGLIYTNPRPTARELSRFYPAEYYQLPALTLSLSRFERWMGLLYGDENGTEAGNLTRAWFLRRLARRLLARLFPYEVNKLLPLPLALLGKQGRLLDVGCGHGYYLWKIRNMTVGWECYGLDMSPNAFAYIRNDPQIRCFVGELADAEFPAAFFDLVTLWHVLEHLRSPQAALAEIHRLLKPSGLLIVAVPNIASLESRIFGRHWLHLDLPRHCYHFSRRTLTEMLLKARFEIVKFQRTRSGGGSHSFAFFLEERASDQNTMLFVLVRRLLHLVCLVADKCLLGGQVKVICRKPQ